MALLEKIFRLFIIITFFDIHISGQQIETLKSEKDRKNCCNNYDRNNLCRDEFETRPGRNYKTFERCLQKNGTLQPVTFYCSCGRYFDKDSKACLPIPGGGEVMYADYKAQCKDQYRGVLVHPTQRQFYYVCKECMVLVVKCPHLKVYDSELKYCVDIEKQCTVTIHDESNGNITTPPCKKPGRFAVDNEPFYFYMCTADGEKFYKSIFKCPTGSQYDPDILACSQIYVGSTMRSQKLGWHLLSDPYPPCMASGRFRSDKNCSLYYVCSAKMNGTFYQTRYACPSGMMFSETLLKCMPEEEVECYIQPEENGDSCECIESNETHTTTSGTIYYEDSMEDVTDKIIQTTRTDNLLATTDTTTILSDVSKEQDKDIESLMSASEEDCDDCSNTENYDLVKTTIYGEIDKTHDSNENNSGAEDNNYYFGNEDDVTEKLKEENSSWETGENEDKELASTIKSHFYTSKKVESSTPAGIVKQIAATDDEYSSGDFEDSIVSGESTTQDYSRNGSLSPLYDDSMDQDVEKESQVSTSNEACDDCSNTENDDFVETTTDGKIYTIYDSNKNNSDVITDDGSYYSGSEEDSTEMLEKEKSSSETDEDEYKEMPEEKASTKEINVVTSREGESSTLAGIVEQSTYDLITATDDDNFSGDFEDSIVSGESTTDDYSENWPLTTINDVSKEQDEEKESQVSTSDEDCDECSNTENYDLVETTTDGEMYTTLHSNNFVGSTDDGSYYSGSEEEITEILDKEKSSTETENNEEKQTSEESESTNGIYVFTNGKVESSTPAGIVKQTMHSMITTVDDESLSGYFEDTMKSGESTTDYYSGNWSLTTINDVSKKQDEEKESQVSTTDEDCDNCSNTESDDFVETTTDGKIYTIYDSNKNNFGVSTDDGSYYSGSEEESTETLEKEKFSSETVDNEDKETSEEKSSTIEIDLVTSREGESSTPAGIVKQSSYNMITATDDVHFSGDFEDTVGSGESTTEDWSLSTIYDDEDISRDNEKLTEKYQDSYESEVVTSEDDFEISDATESVDIDTYFSNKEDTYSKELDSDENATIEYGFTTVDYGGLFDNNTGNSNGSDSEYNHTFDSDESLIGFMELNNETIFSIEPVYMVGTTESILDYALSTVGQNDDYSPELPNEFEVNSTETSEVECTGLMADTFIDYDIQCTTEGAFSINNSCHMYFECVWNKKGKLEAQVLECPKCLRFNEKVGYCDLPQNVPRCSPFYLDAKSQCQEPGFHHIAGECDRYKECFLKPDGEFEVIIHTCPEGLNFNKSTKKCDGGIMCDERKSPNCTASGFFPDDERCNEFYQCVLKSGDDFEYKRYRCPPGLVYNNKIGSCDLPKNVPWCAKIFR